MPVINAVLRKIFVGVPGSGKEEEVVVVVVVVVEEEEGGSL